MATDTRRKPTETEKLTLLAELKNEFARKDLQEFAKRIDPRKATEYSARHIGMICEALEALERGEITRLFITAPPRHWKSSTATEKFPTWYLARNPKHSVVITAHAAWLARQFSVSVRSNILKNPIFQELFPAVKISDESSRADDWMLQGAFRSSLRAIGVGGGLTGTGANLIAIDDPIADDEQAYSPRARETVWQWYRETLRDRLEPGGKIVLTMSRWHQQDLAGRLIKESEAGSGEKWTELRLPATDETWSFALWPERWPIEELKKSKQGVGNRAFTARFLGTPRQTEGNILDSTKLVMINEDELPEMVKVVRPWDLAFSKTVGSDWVAGVKMGLDRDGNRYIMHLKRNQGRWPETKPKIIETAQREGPSVIVGIESNGTQLGYFQDIKDDKRMMCHVVESNRPEGSKEMRASIWGSRLEDGIIKCVRGPWNQELFDEMDYFPAGEHDDCVDAVSAGWKMLATNTSSAKSVSVERSSRVAGAGRRSPLM